MSSNPSRAGRTPTPERRGRARAGARLLTLATVLSWAAAIAAIAFELSPVVLRHEIAREDIGHVRGHLYATVIRKPPGLPLLDTMGDDYETRRSGLRLTENGAPLATAHAPQPAIEQLGRGRYLHLRRTELYFASSDNTDPRANGRRYAFELPMRPVRGLSFWLFATASALGAAMLSTSTAGARLRAAVTARVPRRWLAAALFATISAAWLAQAWAPAPMVVSTGDGGNVAAIAAGWLHRERFADDPVLAQARTTAIYTAAAVPVTVALGALLGDVGQGYTAAIFALVLVQLAGFALLGRRLFGAAWAAVALALLTLPAVYVFGGELWGQFESPLTRGYFGAAFPFLLLLLLRRTREATPTRLVTPPGPPVASLRHVVAVMAACGAAIYLHPVSAPSVAAGCWLALAASRAPSGGWAAHLGRLTAGAAVFLLFALPFFAALSAGSAGTDAGAQAEAVRDAARQAVRVAAGAQYFDVRVVLDSLAGGAGAGWGWRWWVWAAGAAGLVLVPRLQPQAGADIRALRWFLAGLLASSLGAAAADQWLAARLGRDPLQIDLVRNVRFAVPVLLTGALWLAVALARHRSRPWRVGAIAAAVVLVTLGWWHAHPNPIAAAIAQRASGVAPRDARTPADREAITALRRLPAGTAVLPLGGGAGAESAIELVGLAVRYGALQPVAFLHKDVNFLSYSASRGVLDWLAVRKRTDALYARDAGEPVADRLAALVRASGARALLVETSGTEAALLAAARASGTLHAAHGGWEIVRLDGLGPSR